MFKPARWWSEKNRVKVDFKLQFHASQVTHVGGDGLMISIVPAESGKPTVKSDKATVRDGSCFWDNPVYETVKFNQDPKSGKIHEKIYYFVIETGLSKSGIVGEASIDLSNYAEANKVSLVSLPIKNSKTEATLHVSIQRIQESMDQREIDESENEKLHSVDNHDMDGTIRTNSTDDMPLNKIVLSTELHLNANHRASSGSDVTISSSEISSGIEAPWEMQMNNDIIHHEPDGYCTDDSLNTPKVNFLSRDSEEAPDILIEKLKSDNAALSRRAEMCELELQTLRKQIVKESKRGNDFWREIVELKEERDALKGECDYLKALKRRTDVGARMKTNTVLDGVDSQAIIEELKQELNHAKELNSNLQIQLRKTQESNSELILAVQDLDEMLEQKNKEMFDVNNREASPTCELDDDDDDDDDDEQRALEDLVKEHSDDKEAYLLEQQIVDLRNEIESYKRDKDELEMQMEQLALDYEIMKQANHEMSNRLEQSQIQEQLKMQYECSSSDTSADELEIRMENVENELKIRSKEYTDSLVTISALEGHAKRLEEELEKQARGFEADLEALTSEKVEQEKRAIRAEEMLKKMRWKNANTAERLQEEFRRLSVQMASTFEANERLATNALAEANELRLQKGRLEETLRKSYEELESIKGDYETRLHQLMNQIEQMQTEIEDKAARLEDQKLLSDEILMLRDEIESHVAKNKILSDEMASKKSLMHEVEQMRMLVKEKELLLEQANDERIELERMVESVKNEADESRKELNEMRCLLKDKEMIVSNLESEVESLRARCTEFKDARLEDETEIEKLSKQVIQLKSDMKKKEDAFNSTEKKIKDGNGRGMIVDVAKATSKTSKPVFRASKEVANLKERIKLLESQIKSKETALETSTNKFLEKEKDLHYKIKELEGRLQSSARFCENEVDKPTSAVVEDQAPNYRAILSLKSNDLSDDELRDEMALLKEKNKSMEEDLMEMQEKYLDISLKFAEVEGERQQLVMKLRNITNANKSS